MRRFGHVFRSIEEYPDENVEPWRRELKDLTEDMVKLLPRSVLKALFSWAHKVQARRLAQWCYLPLVTNSTPKEDSSEEQAAEEGGHNDDAYISRRRDIIPMDNREPTNLIRLSSSPARSVEELGSRPVKTRSENVDTTGQSSDIDTSDVLNQSIKTSAAMKKSFKLLASHIAYRSGRKSSLKRSFDETMEFFDCGKKLKKQKGHQKALRDIRSRGEPHPNLPPCGLQELRVLGAFIGKAQFTKAKQKTAISEAFDNLMDALSGSRQVGQGREALDLEANDLAREWKKKTQ